MCNGYTHTVVITIGRHVGTKPMDQQRWNTFKLDVSLLLLLEGVQTLQEPQFGNMRAHDQVGTWEGKTEPAAAFVGFIKGYDAIVAVRNGLARLATKYQQDAIGCIIVVGTDHLVCP